MGSGQTAPYQSHPENKPESGGACRGEKTLGRDLTL
jgi:hypothetical protein